MAGSSPAMTPLGRTQTLNLAPMGRSPGGRWRLQQVRHFVAGRIRLDGLICVNDIDRSPVPGGPCQRRRNGNGRSDRSSFSRRRLAGARRGLRRSRREVLFPRQLHSRRGVRRLFLFGYAFVISLAVVAAWVCRSTYRPISPFGSKSRHSTLGDNCSRSRPRGPLPRSRTALRRKAAEAAGGEIAEPLRRPFNGLVGG